MKGFKKSFPFLAVILLCSCKTNEAGSQYAVSYDAPDASDAQLMASKHPFVSEQEAIKNQQVIIANMVWQLDSPPKLLRREFPKYPEEVRALVERDHGSGRL